MSKKIDNPPAFPAQFIGPDFNPGQAGMTLRDYFAGQALAGMASGDIDHEEGWSDYARCAYKAADAMLRARQTTPSHDD